MKLNLQNKILSSLLVVSVSLTSLSSQEEVDFLDRVGDSPKKPTTSTTTEPIPKTTTTETTKPISSSTTTVTLPATETKKSKTKSKKKSTTTATTASPDANALSEKASSLVKEPTIAETNPSPSDSRWIEPGLSVDPSYLPLYGSKENSIETVSNNPITETPATTQEVVPSRPKVDPSSLSTVKTSFWDSFWDKYMKAILIVIVLVSFALYHKLRGGQPSRRSSSGMSGSRRYKK